MWIRVSSVCWCYLILFNISASVTICAKCWVSIWAHISSIYLTSWSFKGWSATQSLLHLANGNIYFLYPLQLHMHWCACAYHEKLQLALWVKGCWGYKPRQPYAECPRLVWGPHGLILPSALRGSLGQQWLTRHTESKAPVLKKHIQLLPDCWVEGYFNSHHSTWQRAPCGISHWQKSSWPGLNKNEHQ